MGFISVKIQHLQYKRYEGYFLTEFPGKKSVLNLKSYKSTYVFRVKQIQLMNLGMVLRSWKSDSLPLHTSFTDVSILHSVSTPKTL